MTNPIQNPIRKNVMGENALAARKKDFTPFVVPEIPTGAKKTKGRWWWLSNTPSKKPAAKNGKTVFLNLGIVKIVKKKKNAEDQ